MQAVDIGAIAMKGHFWFASAPLQSFSILGYAAAEEEVAEEERTIAHDAVLFSEHNRS